MKARRNHSPDADQMPATRLDGNKPRRAGTCSGLRGSGHHLPLAADPSTADRPSDTRRWQIAWLSATTLHLFVFGLLVGLAAWAVDDVRLPGERTVLSLQISRRETSPAVADGAVTGELRQELARVWPAGETGSGPAIQPRPVPVNRRPQVADRRRLGMVGEPAVERPAGGDLVSAAATRPMEGEQRVQRPDPANMVVSLPAADHQRRQPAVLPLPRRQVGIETTPARPFYNPLPVYPPEALRRGLDGRVVLRLTISAEGEVTKLTVAGSSGHAILDQAAVAAVSRWRFIAATWAGRPVSWSARLPVHFRRS